MIKKIFNKIKFILGYLMVFIFFWYLNSGFLAGEIWLPLQALFFTIICYFILKVRKLRLIHWFVFIASLYFSSAILEIFKVQVFPEIIASSGFGVLVILIAPRILVRSD